MSWDASLYEVSVITDCPDCGRKLEVPRKSKSCIGWWNYTHNVTLMIYDALEVLDIALQPDESWWQRLNGMDGPASRTYLAAIISQLEDEPGRYRAMNPPSGWGAYDGEHGVLKTLHEMLDAIPDPEETRVEWHVSG